MTIKATIKQSGKVTHQRTDFADTHAARTWASVQGVVGFDFVPMGSSRASFIDTDRNASLSLESA